MKNYALLSRYHATQFVIFVFTWLQNLTLRFTQIQIHKLPTPSLDPWQGFVPGPTGDLCTHNSMRLHPLILGLRSAHDQNAQGVERKENGDWQNVCLEQGTRQSRLLCVDIVQFRRELKSVLFTGDRSYVPHRWGRQRMILLSYLRSYFYVCRHLLQWNDTNFRISW